jgi:hypothetical protein
MKGRTPNGVQRKYVASERTQHYARARTLKERRCDLAYLGLSC